MLRLIYSSFNKHHSSPSYDKNTPKNVWGGIRGVRVIVLGDGQCDPSTNLDVDACISQNANTVRKCLNPTLLLSSMGKNRVDCTL